MPVWQRCRTSTRQWEARETITISRFFTVRSCIAQSMSSGLPIFEKAASSSPWLMALSVASKQVRMKKRPVSGSSNWEDEVMLQSWPARKPATSATKPLRSGQVSVSTYWLASGAAMVVPVG